MAKSKKQPKKSLHTKLLKSFTKDLNHYVDHLFLIASQKGWTWTQLARESGTSYLTISRLGHRETTTPQLLTVWKIAKALDVPITIHEGLLYKQAS